MSEKSIIIIGAGLAGLSTGCYAQMNGYRSRIFESNNISGGLCTSWKRKGYTFDGCIHWLVGSRFGLFHNFYEELGAVQDRPMIDHDEFLRVEGADGKTWIIYSDLDRLEKHMKELSPSDGSVIEELCKGARVFARYEMPLKKPMELVGFFDVLKLLKIIPMLGAIRKYSRISVRDYAARFKDPFLREVFPLLIDAHEGFPMMVFLMTLAYLHKKNAGWPIGGSKKLARAIEQRYLGLGGEVQYKKCVKKILVENDRAVGVRLADGTEHRADIVISAADGRTTIFDMLGGQYINDKIRSYYDEWLIYQPIIQISFGVARDFSKEPHSAMIYFDEPITVGGKVRNRATIQHYCHDSTMAPSGKSVITVSFMKNNYSYWKKLYDEGESYKVEKQQLVDAVIDQLEKRYSGIKKQIELVDVTTPVTYERHTGNWQGSYMGWGDTTKALGKLMKRTLPGLDRFYMAGQWVYVGAGVPGAVMSGRHLMQIICKTDRKSFVTSVP